MINLFIGENAALLMGFFASLFCAVAVVLTTKWHGRFSLDGTHGVQKNHSIPCPRIGGLSIFVGLAVVYAFTRGDSDEILAALLVASLPAFCFGFLEDLTKRVSVRARLLATMASGGLAWSITGTSLTQLGVPGLDTLLAWLPFSVLFTAFAVGGVANAVNIIDGFHGLASGTVAICTGALGVIALRAGDVALAQTCFMVCTVIAGFLVVNFPSGKIFLGDGGAYMLGFLMAWLAIMLPVRNPGVSVWASFAACGYPIFETLFSIARRVWLRSHPGLADSHHLHSLIKISVTNRLFKNLPPYLRNAFVSPFCWLIALLAGGLAVANANDSAALVASILFTFLAYLGFYWYVATTASVLAPNAARATLSVVVPVRRQAYPASEAAVREDAKAAARVG
jgi:UDP-N-acetylmuramyl pentapeptide phosphotransferase/UDP-N-acetylglucosamine-1-phosphate transferase